MCPNVGAILVVLRVFIVNGLAFRRKHLLFCVEVQVYCDLVCLRPPFGLIAVAVDPHLYRLGVTNVEKDVLLIEDPVNTVLWLWSIIRATLLIVALAHALDPGGFVTVSYGARHTLILAALALITAGVTSW